MIDLRKKTNARPNDRAIAMPKVGVEPTLPEENYALNVARLPVPPLRLLFSLQYSRSCPLVNTRLLEIQGNRFKTGIRCDEQN